MYIISSILTVTGPKEMWGPQACALRETSSRRKDGDFGNRWTWHPKKLRGKSVKETKKRIQRVQTQILVLNTGGWWPHSILCVPWDWLGNCGNRIALLTYTGPPESTSEGVFTQQTEEEIGVWSEWEIGTLFKEWMKWGRAVPQDKSRVWERRWRRVS